MTCPHCQKEIPVSAISRHFAAHGGAKSKRKIAPEQQAMMQAARAAKSQTKQPKP